LQREWKVLKELVDEKKYPEVMERAEKLRMDFPNDENLARLVEFARTQQSQVERQTLLSKATERIKTLSAANRFQDAVQAAQEALKTFPGNKDLLLLQQQAELQSARDSATFDEREYDRKKMLVASDFTPRAVFERAETNLKVSRQRISSIEQQIANTIVALDGDPDIDVNRHPTVRAAKAQLDRARLDLSYATVTAPEDGVVTRVDDLQIGGFVNAGAPVFSLLSSRRIWIEANFRETGLTHMRTGQEATIDVDAYPDRRFRAHIVSMSPGTGSDFSVLPPENATGNWVKVVQRLPVRLEFDDVDASRPLFSGISVTARVDTGYRSSLRHLLQPAQAREVK